MVTWKGCGTWDKEGRWINFGKEPTLKFFSNFANSIWNARRMVVDKYDFSFFVFGREMNKKSLDWLLRRYWIIPRLPSQSISVDWREMFIFYSYKRQTPKYRLLLVWCKDIFSLWVPRHYSCLCWGSDSGYQKCMPNQLWVGHMRPIGVGLSGSINTRVGRFFNLWTTSGSGSKI
jgi:hypothetical protein